MISKVSAKPDWMDNSVGFQRNSVGKSAMSAFEAVLVKQAGAMRTQGMSDIDIAAKFNISVDILSHLLAPVTKVACACESESEVEAYDKLNTAKTNDDALKAYNELHGIEAKEPEVMVARSRNPILSAAGGRTDVTDIGGPTKQIKSQTSNSIWDAEVLERNAKVKGNDEILQEEKAQREAQKEELKSASRYQTIDGKSLESYLKEAGTTKGNSVSSAASLPATEPHKYNQKLPSNSISMFESGDYERLPEKTEGEKIAASKQTVKDRSWLNNTKSMTTKDIFNSMIDSFVKED